MLALAHRSRRSRETLLAGSLWGLTMALSACTSLPPPGSVAADEKRWLMIRTDCRRYPERYGFPYSREEYVRTQFVFGTWIPDLGNYCSRVARTLADP